MGGVFESIVKKKERGGGEFFNPQGLKMEEALFGRPLAVLT